MTACSAFIPTELVRSGREICLSDRSDLLSPMKTCKEADISNIGEAAMHEEKTKDSTVKSRENRERPIEEKRRLDWIE